MSDVVSRTNRASSGSASRPSGDSRSCAQSQPDARLADAQFALAKEHGFPSWRALKAHVDSLSVEGQLFDAAKAGDVAALTALLDAHPDKLHVRNQPYEWSLLHAAAHTGHLAAVDLLLRRGIDANTREKGDNTYPMHWAAAAGHVDVVRRLADAGGEVIGRGDDHELELIGWATCWDGGDDDTASGGGGAAGQPRRKASHLLGHRARPRRRSQAHRRSRSIGPHPAHEPPRGDRGCRFTSRSRRIVPRWSRCCSSSGPTRSGPTRQANRDGLRDTPDVDRAVMGRSRRSPPRSCSAPTAAAVRARQRPPDLLAATSLRDWPTAERLLQREPAAEVVRRAPPAREAQRRGGRQLAARSRRRSQRPWPHWDADVTPLHLAILGPTPRLRRLLLDAGADTTIHDSKHDEDALDWAEFFEKGEIVAMIDAHRTRGG